MSKQFIFSYQRRKKRKRAKRKGKKAQKKVGKRKTSRASSILNLEENLGTRGLFRFDLKSIFPEKATRLFFFPEKVILKNCR